MSLPIRNSEVDIFISVFNPEAWIDGGQNCLLPHLPPSHT